MTQQQVHSTHPQAAREAVIYEYHNQAPAVTYRTSHADYVSLNRVAATLEDNPPVAMKMCTQLNATLTLSPSRQTHIHKHCYVDAYDVLRRGDGGGKTHLSHGVGQLLADECHQVGERRTTVGVGVPALRHARVPDDD